MKRLFLVFLVTATLFVSCRTKQAKEISYNWKEKGDSLVSKTFDTLRNTLLRAIGEKDFPGAVEFCNTQALTLTQSWSEEGIMIKRSSDRWRNPSNAPDSQEQRVLEMYHRLKSGSQELKAVLEKDAAGNHHYFKPILIQSMCLNCHGSKNEQINPETWKMIQLKYPSDSAFGYKEGDLRGIWHITFTAIKNGKP